MWHLHAIGQGVRYEIADHALALPPFICQTVNPISSKGPWTPNLMF